MKRNVTVNKLMVFVVFPTHPHFLPSY